MTGAVGPESWALCPAAQAELASLGLVVSSGHVPHQSLGPAQLPRLSPKSSVLCFLPGFLKTIPAPSPILQSLQHPPTLLLLPPDSGGPLLAPRASPPSQAPAPSPRPPSLLTAPPHISALLPAATAAPGAFSPLPPSLFQGAVLVPSPRPSASLPPALTTSPPPCWHQGALREHSSHWMEPGCLQCACEVRTLPPAPRLPRLRSGQSPANRPVPLQGGQVVCEAESCRIACSHPLPPKDRGCCPSCTGETRAP